MLAANKRILRRMSLSFLLALFGIAMSQAAEPSSCGQYGTALQWTAEVNAAFSQARDQSKLVLVLHLSGNFTKSSFT